MAEAINMVELRFFGKKFPFVPIHIHYPHLHTTPLDSSQQLSFPHFLRLRNTLFSLYDIQIQQIDVTIDP